MGVGQAHNPGGLRCCGGDREIARDGLQCLILKPSEWVKFYTLLHGEVVLNVQLKSDI